MSLLGILTISSLFAIADLISVGCDVTIFHEVSENIECNTSEGTPLSIASGTVRPGTICFIGCAHTTVTWRRCLDDSTWEGPKLNCDRVFNPKRKKLKRKKKWLFGGRRRSPPPPPPPPPPNQAPVIAGCPSFSSTLYAPQRQSSRVVSWNIPTAHDPEQGQLSVTQNCGGRRGGRFGHGSHQVCYRATDNKGAAATCVFSFTVVVRTCSYPAATQATVLCSPGGIQSGSSRKLLWGSVCSYSCASGLTLSGDRSISCLSSGSISAAPATCTDRHPPTFTSCPTSQTIVCARNARSAAISYTEPRATDTNARSTVSLRRTGPASGAVLGVGRRDVIYRASDAAGNEAVCQFSFTIRLIQCSTPRSANVRYTCSTSDYIRGTECSMECEAGYVSSDETSTTCDVENTSTGVGTWSNGGSMACSKVSCQGLSTPAHGSVTCSGDSLVWGTRCEYSCASGYTLHGDRTLVCTKTGDYDHQPPTCQDITRPEFTSCPTSITDYADKYQRRTRVTWLLPEVSDDASETNMSQSIGPAPGTSFPTGITQVEYTAVDVSGNLATPCHFTVTVLLITCPDPRFSDASVEYDCTEENYIWGTECNLTCRATLALEGSDVMTCDRAEHSSRGTWLLSNGLEPSCNPCPDIPPPINGAVACSSDKAVCQIQCAEGFDAPTRLGARQDLLFICTSTRWLHFVDMYDCKASTRRRKHLPGGFYFGGRCEDDGGGVSTIGQNFRDTIQRTLFRGIIEDQTVVFCG